jgi:hypothetical protein
MLELQKEKTRIEEDYENSLEDVVQQHKSQLTKEKRAIENNHKKEIIKIESESRQKYHQELNKLKDQFSHIVEPVYSTCFLSLFFIFLENWGNS